VDIDQIIAVLGASDVDHEELIERLAGHGDAAVAPLVEALHGHQDVHARTEAAEALRRLAGRVGENAAAEIEDALLNHVIDSAERGFIAGYGEAIRLRRRTRRATRNGALLVALRSDELFVPERAAVALGEVGDAAVVPELVDSLLRAADRDYGTDQIIAPLARFGVHAADALLSVLDDADGARLVAVESALAEIAGDAAGRLVEALESPSPKVRASAAATLGGAPAAVAVDPLIDVLHDADPAVAAAAATALGELADPRAAESCSKCCTRAILWSATQRPRPSRQWTAFAR
jgi:hypothetical protein